MSRNLTWFGVSGDETTLGFLVSLSEHENNRTPQRNVCHKHGHFPTCFSFEPSSDGFCLPGNKEDRCGTQLLFSHISDEEMLTNACSPLQILQNPYGHHLFALCSFILLSFTIFHSQLKHPHSQLCCFCSLGLCNHFSQSSIYGSIKIS
jgi:hypothetical protein